jgi:hypothetical protein
MVDAIEKVYANIDIAYVRQTPTYQPLSTRAAHRIVVRKRAQVAKLLGIIYPYLRVKDAEAKAVIDFVGRFPSDHRQPRSTLVDRKLVIDTLRSLKKVA